MSFGHKDTIIIGKAIGPWQTHHHVGLTSDLSASGNYPSVLCDLAEYAHPEFANPFVNLMCVGAPVAED
jgi:hypothetical protein